MLGYREGAESEGQRRRHSKPGVRGGRWDMAYRRIGRGPEGGSWCSQGHQQGKAQGDRPFILSVMGSQGQEEVK